MNHASHPVAASLLATLLLAVASPAAASPLTADVEVDPTAYVLDGHSIHAGLNRGHLRLDLGAFAMALPHAVHGADGFDVSFAGFGAKLQWFRRADRTGWFVGVDAGVVTMHARRQGTTMSVDDRQVSTGVNAGYRLDLPHGLYATAWLGVGRAWSTEPVTLAGATYEPSSVTVFPAIHLGYRFE